MRLFISFLSAVSLFLSLGCSSSSITMPERGLLIISNDMTSIEVLTP